MTAPDTKAIRAKAKMWHLPAGIADDILALCDAYEYSRLAVAHANDHADTAISDMQELRAEIERLRRMLDLRGTGRAERYWEGRWRDEAAENERLTKERDCALTQARSALSRTGEKGVMAVSLAQGGGE